MDGTPCKKLCCCMFEFSVDIWMKFICLSQKEEKSFFKSGNYLLQRKVYFREAFFFKLKWSATQLQIQHTGYLQRNTQVNTSAKRIHANPFPSSLQAEKNHCMTSGALPDYWRHTLHRNDFKYVKYCWHGKKHFY